MSAKQILVTGVSRGIGRAVVQEFCECGHHVYGISRNAQALDEIAAAYGNFHPLKVDLTAMDIATLPELLPHSGLDVLVNNAGAILNKPFEQIEHEEWQHLYEVNVHVPFRLIQGLLPLLKAAKGHVVNVGSMGGMNGTVKFPGLSAYSSSKGALAIMSECLAEELKESGVRINCLALGSANTEMLKAAFPDFSSPVSAEQMATWVVYFSLNASHLFNGKTIPVSASTP